MVMRRYKMNHTKEFKEAKAKEFRDMSLYDKFAILLELSDLVPIEAMVDELSDDVVHAMVEILDMGEE